VLAFASVIYPASLLNALTLLGIVGNTVLTKAVVATFVELSADEGVVEYKYADTSYLAIRPYAGIEVAFPV
jgi:hypothetical protein